MLCKRGDVLSERQIPPVLSVAYSFYVCVFMREGVGGEVRKLEREQSRVIERNHGEQNIRGEKI